MSTLGYFIVAAAACMALALFLGVVRAYERRPEEAPTPRDLEPWGDWPAPVDLDETKGRE